MLQLQRRGMARAACASASLNSAAERWAGEATLRFSVNVRLCAAQQVQPDKGRAFVRLVHNDGKVRRRVDCWPKDARGGPSLPHRLLCGRRAGRATTVVAYGGGTLLGVRTRASLRKAYTNCLSSEVVLPGEEYTMTSSRPFAPGTEPTTGWDGVM